MPLLESSKHVSPDIFIITVVHVLKQYKIVKPTLEMEFVLNAIEMLTDSGLFKQMVANFVFPNKISFQIVTPIIIRELDA